MKKIFSLAMIGLLLSSCAISIESSYNLSSTSQSSYTGESTSVLTNNSSQTIISSSISTDNASSSDLSSSSPIDSTSSPIESSSSHISIPTEPLPLEVYEIRNIPTINITTPESIVTKEYVYNTNVTLSNAEIDKHNFSMAGARIKCRGNSSFFGDNGKNSYKIHFDDKIDVLGFGKHKEWNLVANYFDRSMLRNFIVYQTTHLLDGLSDFQMDCAFVELYINQVYRGLYLLTESIESNGNRLDIEIDINPNTTEIPYLIELDHKILAETGMKENVDYFFSHGNPYGMKYPKTLSELTSSQQNYIKNSINVLYDYANSADSNNNWINVIDTNSFIDYFILQEFFRNPDIGHSSVFMYKQNGQKIKAGPIWDFDLAMGNYSDWGLDYSPIHLINSVTGQANALYNSLMKSASFLNLYLLRWNLFKTNVAPLLKTALQNYKSNTVLADAVNRDNQKWKTWNNYVSQLANNPNIIALNSFNNHIDYLLNYLFNGLNTSRNDSDSTKRYYQGRLDWLTANLANYNSLVGIKP